MPGGYKKREMNGVGIGPKDNQLKKIEGLLVGIEQDVGENHSTLYEMVLRNGESQNVWGSTTIDQAIRQSDIGKLITISFIGMGTSKSGRKFKDIEVGVWYGEPDERVRNWPGFVEPAVPVSTDGNEYAAETDSPDEDEDLPFDQ